MRKNQLLTFFLMFTLMSAPLMFVSCSGGGGGGGDTPSNGTGGTVQTQAVGISGVVTVNGARPQGALTVTVKSIDDKGNVVATETTTTLVSQSNSSLNGSYKVSVGLVKGGKAVIIAEGSGYTKATKTINYNGGTDITINLDVKQVTTQTVNVSNGISITDSGKKYLRVAFVKDKDTGKLMAKTGIEAQSADPDSKVMDLAIPLDKLQSGTQDVNVSLKSYSPSNPNDYQDFPGTDTTDGNQLVSFGFDYLEITDQNGNNPFVSSSSISSQLVSGEYYRILRIVDCTQIKNLINTGVITDEDSGKAGIQFTFYAYDFDKGAWVTAGQGTFVENNGINYTNSEWDTIIQSGCDPNSTSTDNADGSAGCDEYGVIQDINKICDGTDKDYVVVSVTNPALEWKNLDYIIPGGSTVSCNITVIDKDTNKPLTGAYVYANSTCLAWISGITDSNGIVTLSTIGYSNPCKADVSAWYMMKEGKTQADFNGNCNVTISIENPYKCKVKGKVVDENNKPIEGLVVYAYASNYGYYSQDDVSSQKEIFENLLDITDSNGEFSINTKCNTQGNVFIKMTTSRSFNVNNNVEAGEVSDDGTTVDVGTIQVVNDPPYGYIYGSAPRINDPYKFELCVYDLEKDYPVSYSITVKKNGTDFKTFNGQLDLNNLCAKHTFTPDSQGTYIISGTVKDSKNNEAPTSYDNLFFIDASNHFISGYVMSYGLSMDLSGFGGMSSYTMVYLSGFFNDSRSHRLTSSASYKCYDAGGNEKVSGGPVSGSSGVTVNLNSQTQTGLADSDYCIFDLNVNDGTNTINATKKAKIYGK